MVKCQWCKEQGDKSEMHIESKATGKILKSGKPQMSNKYTHLKCLEAVEEDKKFKQQELEELDQLQKYLTNLHGMVELTDRMYAEINDLRNGSIKHNSVKLKKYKKGVSFPFMLETYKYAEPLIRKLIDSMKFENKWNEFKYMFAVMTNKLDEFADFYRRKQDHHQIEDNREVEHIEIEVENTVSRKKDKLDISEWL